MAATAIFCWLILLVLSVSYDMRGLWAFRPVHFQFSIRRVLALTLLVAATVRLLMVFGWDSGPNLLLGMLVLVLLAVGIEIISHFHQSRRAEKQMHRVKSNALPDRLDEMGTPQPSARRTKFRIKSAGSRQTSPGAYWGR